MAVLLMRLCGPMQSWGTQSRFSHRDSDLEPSKSGVIGLLCAAMGRPRDDHNYIEKLARLKMGVRVDMEGILKKDFHTAGGWHFKKDEKYGVPTADGKSRRTVISDRYYLADACFLVALKGDLDLLQELHNALQAPIWQLYLGRKSFVPGLPVWLKDGLLDHCEDALKALKTYPYLCISYKDNKLPDKVRVEMETEFGVGERVKQDQPISFAQGNRKFGLRHVTTTWIEKEKLPPAKEDALCSFLV